MDFRVDSNLPNSARRDTDGEHGQIANEKVKSNLPRETYKVTGHIQVLGDENDAATSEAERAVLERLINVSKHLRVENSRLPQNISRIQGKDGVRFAVGHSMEVPRQGDCL